MTASQHVKDYDRAQLLETLCRVWEVNREWAIERAMEYARTARDTHDEGLLKQAKWQRELADMFDERLKRDRAELVSLRGVL